MLPNQALRDGFSLWLDEIVDGRRVRPGRLWLDPFATSCRNTQRFAPWLADVMGGAAPRSKDPGQSMADMRAMGVVAGDVSQPTITAMGARVSARWDELGITAAEGQLAEVARCAVLYREGARSADEHVALRYEGYMTSLVRLMQVRRATYWTSDLYTLYLPCYLDQEDARGFNPFEVLILLCDGEIGTPDQWRAWAAEDWEGSSKLTQLLRKVESFRPGGTRAFVQGLEACYVADYLPTQFDSLIQTWGLT